MVVFMSMNRDDKERELNGYKASSLSDDTLQPIARTASGTKKRGRDKKNEVNLSARRKAARGGFVVDLVLLLLVALLSVGGWFGYRALKVLYTPVWDTRQVEFCVEIRNIDYDSADELLPTLEDHGLWYSDTAEGDYLGIVSDVRAVPTITEDGKETMTLYLTVRTQAKYSREQGYFVGSTRILAGETGIYRAEGMIAEGIVVSLDDVTEVDA